MRIFSKKYDIEKDKLLVRFSSETKRFEAYKDNKLIPYNLLSEKSKKLLDKDNNILINNPAYLEHLLKGFKEKDRYQKLKTLGLASGISFELLSASHGTVSEELGSFLNNLVNEPNVIIGIHRIKESTPESVVPDILTDGLIMTSHLSSGAKVAKPSLGDNVSYYADNKTIIKELMYANEYQNAHGSILIKIPDEDLAKDIFEVNDQGIYVLPPKYIIGYIPANKSHHIDTLITSKDLSLGTKVQNNTSGRHL